MKPKKRYLKISTAAIMLDCSPWFVRKLMKTGQLKFIVIGSRSQRICSKSLDKFMNGKKATTDKNEK